MSAIRTGAPGEPGPPKEEAKPAPEPEEVPEGGLRAEMAGGDAATLALFERVYAELRTLANSYFRKLPRGSTLQPTALVHEVYLRLARRPEAPFEGREHFLAVAATAMRQILVDRERARRTQKRGGEASRITLTGQAGPSDEAPEVVDLLALDAALTALAALSPRQARIVELLYFGGLTAEEAAATLEISLSLVEKEWRRARAWLRRELAS